MSYIGTYNQLFTLTASEASDWSAAPFHFKRLFKKTDRLDLGVVADKTSYDGMANASSLDDSIPAPGSDQCQLCGRTIKLKFVVTNDVKHLWAYVGQDCINNFISPEFKKTITEQKNAFAKDELGGQLVLTSLIASQLSRFIDLCALDPSSFNFFSMSRYLGSASYELKRAPLLSFNKLKESIKEFGGDVEQYRAAKISKYDICDAIFHKSYHGHGFGALVESQLGSFVSLALKCTWASPVANASSVRGELVDGYVSTLKSFQKTIQNSNEGSQQVSCVATAMEHLKLVLPGAVSSLKNSDCPDFVISDKISADIEKLRETAAAAVVSAVAKFDVESMVVEYFSTKPIEYVHPRTHMTNKLAVTEGAVSTLVAGAKASVAVLAELIKNNAVLDEISEKIDISRDSPDGLERFSDRWVSAVFLKVIRNHGSQANGSPDRPVSSFDSISKPFLMSVKEVVEAVNREKNSQVEAASKAVSENIEAALAKILGSKHMKFKEYGGRRKQYYISDVASLKELDEADLANLKCHRNEKTGGIYSINLDLVQKIVEAAKKKANAS